MNGNLFGQDTNRGAVISECGLYRYRLWRVWDEPAPAMVWVMLNPSTADADADDPTLRKCIGFAKRHGYGGVTVVNLFAFRSTDPDALKQAADPVGPENDDHILRAARGQMLPTIVAGWGAHPFAARRAAHVVRLIRGVSGRPILCLGKTGDGQPRHPLMPAYATPLEAL